MLNISNDKVTDVLEEDQFYSLRTLRTPSLGRLLAKVLLIMVSVLILSMFLPWQQNIRGTGTVTALNPGNRPQTLESAIAGRIVDWKVAEGDYVTKGDTILSLSEIKEKYFDPLLLQRLEEQLDAKEASITAKERKKNALIAQISSLEEGLVVKQSQVQNKLNQVTLKLQNDSVNYESERVGFDNNTKIFEQNKLRYQAGNMSLNKFRNVESKYQNSMAKIVSAENKWLQSKIELSISKSDIAGFNAEYLGKISKARSDLNATLSDLYDSQGSLAKLRNEFANMTIRNAQYQVLAPQTGYLVKALISGIGETIKAGEPLAIIMPESSDLAAEMYIKAMDLAFLAKGRKVRVQFDGWPALQFSGWPNVSVGTFGGIVAVIDRVDSKAGKFRLIVKPDPEDDPWPEQIRMGSGIKGWVMLDNVSVWYELWRQLNGFPPSIYSGEEEINIKESKDKK